MLSFDNLFEATELTTTINQLPAVPTLLQAAFEEDGVQTTEVAIERKDQALRLVPAVPRGAPGMPYVPTRRDALTFKTAHLPQRAMLLADSLQNVRAFGSNELYTAEQRRNELLVDMRNDIDVTLEHLRFGALTGQVLNADGSVMLDLFAEFGVSQQTYDMDLYNGTYSLSIRTKFVEARRKAEAALGNLRPKRWLCLCSPTFFDVLVDHPSSDSSLVGWAAAAEMRADVRGGFDIAGITVLEYSYGTDDTPWIGSDAAYLVPVGVPGLLIGRYAPADHIDTVNQVGLPYYASADPLPHNKGYSIEAQSNPVFLVTRPRAVIKLTTGSPTP